jgi:hypothetical protein
VKGRPKKSDSDDKRNETNAADAEVERFARAMVDVVRLAPDPRGRVRAAPQVTRPRAATPSTSSSAGEDDHDVSESGFVAPGVDRRELRKL